MEVKDISLSPEDVRVLENLDNTIRHRSTEFTAAALRADSIKDQIKDLYSVRSGFLDKKIAEAGIDRSRVMQTGVHPDGDSAKISVMLKPEPASDPQP